MDNNTVRLEGGNSSLLLQVRPYPRLLYWGPRLSSASQDDALTLAMPTAMHQEAPSSIEAGIGRWQSAAGLAIEGYRDRHSLAPLAFETVSCDCEDGQIRLCCIDKNAELELIIKLSLDAETGVLGLWQRLTNQGDVAFSVRRFGLSLPLAERAIEVMGFHGQWLQAFHTHRIQPQYGGYLQEYRHERQHDQFPGIVVGTAHFSEQHGEVWGAHLAWGGDHRLRVDTRADGRRFLQAEALHQQAEQRLDPGKSCDTPWLYAAYGPHGLNTMSQAFHLYVRQHLGAKRGAAQRPVQLNLPRSVWEAHSRDELRRMAARAARLGVERFIMEIGRTCHARNPSQDDTFELADGQVSAKDIRQLIDYVHDHSMQFGIWLAPERLMADDTCRKRHPEWVLRLSKAEVPEQHAQYVLNLTHSGAWNWLFEQMDHILSEYHINFVKWEFCRELVQSSHEQLAQAQMERATAMLDLLRTRHPETAFEPCVIGGGRIDYGLLRYVRRFWASNASDALDQQRIQYGLSYFFPPEVIGTHVGATHTRARRQSLTIAGLTALFGHMGLTFDVLSLTREQQEGVSRYIALYKQLRGLLHVGRSLRIETLDSASSLAGGIFGARHAVIGVAQLQPSRYTVNEVIRIPGLEPEQNYHIRVLDAPEEVDYQQVPWMNEPTARISGQWLMNAGLRLPRLPAETALLIEIEIAE